MWGVAMSQGVNPFRKIAVLTGLMIFIGGAEISSAATFSFSFTNQTGNTPGTVTGLITGLADNGTSQAAAGVFVTSFPAALNITLSPAFNFATASVQIINSFNVSGGAIASGTQFAAATGSVIPNTE